MGTNSGAGSSDSQIAGKMVGGYELVQKLGRGAMGAVFRARQVAADRTVALKVLPPRLAQDKSFVDRFLREARAAAKLNHPNIVEAIDVGYAEPYYYFAMEYVDGISLKTVLGARNSLPQERALEIAHDIARALGHAHEAGIVHRDVKPDNIMLAAGGMPKLADLGLARAAVGDNRQLAESGKAIGTPDYISPEQARGDEDIDGRTDIYSLGATLYHMLVGQPPYAGNSSVEVMSKHLTEPPPDPRELNTGISPRVSEVIRRAMAKHREQRYQTMAAMRRDIERILSGAKPLAAAPDAAAAGGDTDAETAATAAEDAPPAVPRPRRKRRKGALVVASLVALVAAGASIAFLVTAMKGDRAGGPHASTQPAMTRRDQQQRLAAIQKWVREHPDRYREGIRRYERLEKEIRDITLKREVGVARLTLQKKYDEAADRAFAALKSQADGLMRAGDYDGAIVSYGRAPDNLKAALAERVQRAVADVNAAGEAKVRSALARAQTLARSGRPREGIAELDRLKKVKYARLAGSVAALRGRLEIESERLAEERAKARLAAAKRGVATLLERIESAAGRNNFAEAARLAEAALKSAALKPAADELKPVAAVGRAFASAEACRKAGPEATLRTLIGKNQTLDTKDGSCTGVVKTVTADAVILEKTFKIGGVTKRKESKVLLADLTAETRARLKPKWTPQTPDEHIAAVIMAWRATDTVRMRAALDAAKGHPLHRRYADKLAAISATAVEQGAEKAWRENLAFLAAKEGLTAAETAQMMKALDAFEKDHGATRFAAAKRQVIADLRRVPLEFEAAKAWEKLERFANAGALTKERAATLGKAAEAFRAKYGKTRFAEDHADELATFRAAALEPAAARAWKALEAHGLHNITPARAAQLTAALDDFEQKYGATKFAESKAEKIAELRQAPLEPAAAEAWAKLKPYLRDNLTKAEITEMSGKLDAFQQKYSGTRFAASVANDIFTLRGKTGPHRFNSDLDLVVLGKARRLSPWTAWFARFGSTPDENGILIQPTKVWGVRPPETMTLNAVYMKRLARELRARVIPGLCFGGQNNPLTAQVTDETLKPLASLTHLRYLNLPSCSGISDAGMRHLRGLKQLTLLGLYRTSVTDRGLRSLKGLTQLRWLDLSRSKVTGRGLVHLKGLTRLEELWLHDCGGAVGAGLVHLRGLTRLRLLDIQGCGVRNSELAHLAKMTELRRLLLSSADVTDAGMAVVARMRKLEELNLGDARVGDAGLQRLRGLTQLQTLTISGGKVTNAGLVHLKDMTQLTRLGLVGSKGISDAGLKVLGRYRQLTNLDLRETRITDAGLRHLSKLVALKHVNAYHTGVTEQGAAALKAVLPGVTVQIK